MPLLYAHRTSHLQAPDHYTPWLHDLYARAERGECVIHPVNVTDSIKRTTFQALRITKNGHTQDPAYIASVFVSADPAVLHLPLPTAFTDKPSAAFSIAGIYLGEPTPIPEEIRRLIESPDCPELDESFQVTSGNRSLSITYDHGGFNWAMYSPHHHTAFDNLMQGVIAKSHSQGGSYDYHDKRPHGGLIRITQRHHTGDRFHCDGGYDNESTETITPVFIHPLIGNGTVFSLATTGCWDREADLIHAPSGCTTVHFSCSTFSAAPLGISHAAPNNPHPRMAVITGGHEITKLPKRPSWTFTPQPPQSFGKHKASQPK